MPSQEYNGGLVLEQREKYLNKIKRTKLKWEFKKIILNGINENHIKKIMKS